MIVLGLRGLSGGRVAQESGSWECATRNMCIQNPRRGGSCERGGLSSERLLLTQGERSLCAAMPQPRLPQATSTAAGARWRAAPAHSGLSNIFSWFSFFLSFGWRSDFGAPAVEPRSPSDQRLGYRKSLDGDQMNFRFLRKSKDHSQSKGGKAVSYSRAPTCY